MSIPVPLDGFGSGSSIQNFALLAYPTKDNLLASTPTRNTIGVITTIPITKKVFSPTEPELKIDGMVWVVTGTSGTIGFNAIKKNAIQLRLQSVKQCIAGVWTDVPAMVYQEEKWLEWGMWLVKNGVAYGFNNFIRTNYSMEVSAGNGYLKFLADYSRTAPIASDEKIDFTDYKTVELDVDVLQVAEASNNPNIQGCSVFLISGDAYSSLASIDSAVVATSCSTEKGRQTIRLDVSEINGEYFVAICIRTSSTVKGEMNVYDLVVK